MMQIMSWVYPSRKESAADIRVTSAKRTLKEKITSVAQKRNDRRMGKEE